MEYPWLNASQSWLFDGKILHHIGASDDQVNSLCDIVPLCLIYRVPYRFFHLCWPLFLTIVIALQTLELLIFKGEALSSPRFLLLSCNFSLMNKSSSGDLELSAKCFQDLVLKDHNHPAALINYAAELLCKYSSTVAG